MNQGKYVFSQIAEFIPQRYFERIMVKYKDRTGQWSLTSWSQMLVLMFGQLDGCNSLRELTDITTAHAKKSFHLGFGRTPINRTQLPRVDQIRVYQIFEEFSYHMVELAQKKRIYREFELNRSIYEVMRILGSSLLVKDNIKELLFFNIY